MTTGAPSHPAPLRGIALLLSALLLTGCGGEPEISTLVELEQGLFTGTTRALPDGGTMISWRGLPYARPALGGRRFRQPQPPTRRGAVFSAENFGPACPQPDANPFSVQNDSDRTVAEDCLFLNVFAPARGGNRPVMVWFHRGGLRTGSADARAALPERLVQEGVIVVTVNYRLGVLGYLAHPALTETSGTDPAGSGDYGLLDQIRALQWIQTNIASFGGDPGNVTVFGQGSGGSSIKAIMSAQQVNQDLFRRAIIHSGPIGDQETMTEAENRGASFVGPSGADLCPDAENNEELAVCLRSLDVTELMQAQAAQGFDAAVTQRPGLLEQSVPDALASGGFTGEQVLEGTTLDEGRLFLAAEQILTDRESLETRIQSSSDPQQAYENELKERFERVTDSNIDAIADPAQGLYPLDAFDTADLAVAAVGTDSTLVCPALEQVRAVSGHVPTYAYEFADRDAPSPFGETLEDLPLGAAHTTELQYLLDPAAALEDKFPPFSAALADAMVEHWTAFAKTGSPNPRDGTLPLWDTFSRQGYQSLQVPVWTSRPAADTNRGAVPAHHNCSFWSQQ